MIVSLFRPLKGYKALMQLSGDFPYMARLYQGDFLYKMTPRCLYAIGTMLNSILGGKHICLLKKNRHLILGRRICRQTVAFTVWDVKNRILMCFEGMQFGQLIPENLNGQPSGLNLRSKLYWKSLYIYRNTV
jgi:hypothetical protein